MRQRKTPHCLQFGFFPDRDSRRPAELLAAWESLRLLCECIAAQGWEVTTILASTHEEVITRNRVRYHFTPVAIRPFGGKRLDVFRRLVDSLDADVFHVHGQACPRHTGILSKLFPDIPMLVQDHADRVPRVWRRRAWRLGHANVRAFSFCAREQAQPFVDAGLIGREAAILELPEATCDFSAGDRTASRLVTGVHGNPAVLWVGHLNGNKDPLTVLRGFRLAIEALPLAQLWMCHGNAPLLRDVLALVRPDPALASRVHLLGNVPHSRVQELLRSADMFVLGSHREGSGYALIEALACGIPPVVTDIPSFRSLTGGGTIGALWPCGDHVRFAEQLKFVAEQPADLLRAAILRHYDEHLGKIATGKRFAAAYRALQIPWKSPARDAGC